MTKDFRDLTVEQRRDFLAGWQWATIGGERPAASSQGLFDQGAAEGREHTAKVAEKPEENEP